MQLGQNYGDRLKNDQYLKPGDYLTATDGKRTYYAVLAGNGDLELWYGSGDPANPLGAQYLSLIRDFPTHFGGAFTYFDPAATGLVGFAIMQSDGNFVIYPGTDPQHAGIPYWASQTNHWPPEPGYLLVLGTDGNLRLTVLGTGEIRWQTGLSWANQRVSASTDRMVSDEWLPPNVALRSPNGLYGAVLQNDGNLVLVQATPGGGVDLGKPYWSVFANATSRIVGRSTGRLPFIACMQSDGNFVLYNSRRADAKPALAYWATGTNQPTSDLYTLFLRDGGDLVLVKGTDSRAAPVWCSMTVTTPNAYKAVLQGAAPRLTGIPMFPGQALPQETTFPPITVQVKLENGIIAPPGTKVTFQLFKIQSRYGTGYFGTKDHPAENLTVTLDAQGKATSPPLYVYVTGDAGQLVYLNIFITAVPPAPTPGYTWPTSEVLYYFTVPR